MSDDRSLSNWLQLIVYLPSISLYAWFANALQFTRGFCFVDGVPVSPEATQGLIERIAFIRHTHYGIYP
jgi:hypothetical protein